MSRIIPRPFLIARDEDGAFRITIREMRYNSRSYPIITSTLKDDTFKSATAARAHAMHAPSTGLIAASACHRTALAQRAALSGLPSGAPGTAGSASLRRDALMRRRTALLALRSHACAAREATPSAFEAALAPLLSSILERTANGGGNAPRPAAAPVLWEVSAALQAALHEEAQHPDPDVPASVAQTDGAEGAAAAAAAAAPPPGASGAVVEGGDAPPCELRAQLTSLHAQLAAARRELIARLCCRLQRGWEELDSTDTRLVVLMTSQAAQALVASAPLAAHPPTGAAGGAAGAAAGATAAVTGVGGAVGARVGVGGVDGVVSSGGGTAGAAEAMDLMAQAAASSVVAAGEASLLDEASRA